MEKIENALIETYRHGDYIIEITDSGDVWEAWICHPAYGIKVSMFGFLKARYSYTEVVQAVSANAEEYAEIYREEYEDTE